MLYVIVLSAALDLVPSSVPKGVVLLFNILPSLLVKLLWPYLVSGPVRYARRVVGCSALSFFGMVIVALSGSLFPRLLGISLASFSSGLGEMTYLQLSTLYGSDALGTKAVGWFASGTGGAGIAGAGLWWVLRGIGVRAGLGMSSVRQTVDPRVTHAQSILRAGITTMHGCRLLCASSSRGRHGPRRASGLHPTLRDLCAPSNRRP